MLFDDDANTSADVKLDVSARPVYEYQWVDLAFKDDEGRYFSQSFYHPVTRAGASKSLIVSVGDYSSSSGHAYIKMNTWVIGGGRCHRTWSFVWGSDGQRRVNDDMMRLVAVVGRGVYRTDD